MISGSRDAADGVMIGETLFAVIDADLILVKDATREDGNGLAAGRGLALPTGM